MAWNLTIFLEGELSKLVLFYSTLVKNFIWFRQLDTSPTQPIGVEISASEIERRMAQPFFAATP